MYKITINGNFFLIKRSSDDKEHIRHPKSDIRYIIFNDDIVNPLFRFIGVVDELDCKLKPKQEEFRLNDLIKDNGSPFSSSTELIDYLDLNIGFNNGGGEGNNSLVLFQTKSTFNELEVGDEIGQISLVENTSGIKFINFKDAGLYIWDGINWISDDNSIIDSISQNIIKIDSKYDASNPNNYETNFQLDQRDFINRDRINHIGTQDVTTIVGLSPVAITNNYDDLNNIPFIPPIAPVNSVNGEIGSIILNADNIDDSTTNHKFISQVELDQISSNSFSISQETSTRISDDIVLQQNINTEEGARINEDNIINADLQLLKTELPNYISNNAGQIKLNWTNVNRPIITGFQNAVPQLIPLNNNYTVSSFPTTTYPYLADELIGGGNLIDPDTNYLRELKSGQVITFRIKIGYDRKGVNQQGAIILNIYNPNPTSSFNENLSIPALRGRVSYEQTVQISVIADSVSLDPLYGYELSVVTEFDDGDMDVYIQNITAVYGAVDLFNK